MSIASPYFNVVGETKDFVCLKLDFEATFNGIQIGCMGSVEAIEFNQHLLDNHRLVVADRKNNSSYVVCRKWTSPSDLVDKLQRQGML